MALSINLRTRILYLVHSFVLSYAELFDRIYGAWLGRCAGCQLGKPVEGASKEQARIAAELSTGYPLMKGNS